MKNTTAQSIICGTEFFENARKAANVAAALAKRLSAPLVLVHATGLLIQGSTPKAYDAVSVSERLHEEAERLRGLGATVEEILFPEAPDEVLVTTRAAAAGAPARGVLAWTARAHALAARQCGGALSESSPVPAL